MTAVFLQHWLKLTCKAKHIASIVLLQSPLICIQETRHRTIMRQSCQAGHVLIASLSAISDTFNSLLKVLFIFPSWYLFSFGLDAILSFRWNLPPNSRSNPEERDSLNAHCIQRFKDVEQDYHPHRYSFPRDLHLSPCWWCISRLQCKAFAPPFIQSIFLFIRHYSRNPF